MLRITRNTVHNLLMKKVMEMERDRNRKMNEYVKIIELPEHRKKQEIIYLNTFLSVLGNYDSY